MALKTHEGSCHCGAVRYEADLDLDGGTTRCNCSYCAKVRAWFSFAKGAERFRLLSGAESLTEYRWTPPGRTEPFLTFAFCKVCGVRAYGRGKLEALGGVFHAVPVTTLDDLGDAELAKLPVHYIDGKHDRHEAIPTETGWM